MDFMSEQCSSPAWRVLRDDHYVPFLRSSSETVTACAIGAMVSEFCFFRVAKNGVDGGVPRWARQRRVEIYHTTDSGMRCVAGEEDRGAQQTTRGAGFA